MGCERHVPSDDELVHSAAAQQQFPVDLRDVAFPYGVACQAIATCRRVASMIDGDLDERVAMVASLDEWTGGYRTEFNEEWDSLEKLLGGLKEGLRLLAGAIEDVWDEADTINAGREETREAGDYDPTDYDPSSGR